MNSYRILVLGTLFLTVGLSASKGKDVRRSTLMQMFGGQMDVHCSASQCPDYVQNIKDGLLSGDGLVNVNNNKHIFFNNMISDNSVVESEYTLTGIQELLPLNYDSRPRVEYECTCDQAVLKAFADACIKLHAEQDHYSNPAMYYSAPKNHVTIFNNPLRKVFCQFTKKTK